jgi:hypothetical protein
MELRTALPLLLAAALAHGVATVPATAQHSRDFAFGAGPGILAIGITQAPTLRGSLAWGRGGLLITGRSITATELAPAGSPDEWLFEAGLLLGKRSRQGSLDYAASAGVAHVGGILRGAPIPVQDGPSHPAAALLVWLAAGSPHEEERFATIGLPLEAQVAWAALPRLQLALIGFGNLNSGRSFAGAAVEGRLGSRRR